MTLVGFLRGSTMVVYSRPDAGWSSAECRASRLVDRSRPTTRTVASRRPSRGPSGCPAIVSAMTNAAPEPRAASHRSSLLAKINQQRRLRLHELRVAGPGPPRAGRVLRERRAAVDAGRPRRSRSRATSGPSTRSPTCATKSEYWLGQQGRLVEPVHKPAGSDHYVPVDWDAAIRLVADKLPRPRLARTRPRSTRAAARPTRPRSSTSCSCARSAPTTCPTARTCATSRRAPRCSRRSASGSRRSRTTTSRSPT